MNVVAVVATIKQIKEAKRLLNAYEITEGERGSMTLGRMLEIVIKGDQQFKREYAEYLAEKRARCASRKLVRCR